MPAEYEIRADFDRDTIKIYQAYSDDIADAALQAGRFVPPFSFHRMTWIKPSFLWLMHRSNWGLKSGQKRVLAVTIKRSGWEQALAAAVNTSFDARTFTSNDDWVERFGAATVHLQWDTERSLRGAALPYHSIQIGLSRHVIREYVESWIVAIEDRTAQVRKLYQLIQSGQADKAKRQLPPERLYPVAESLRKSLLMSPAGKTR